MIKSKPKALIHTMEKLVSRNTRRAAQKPTCAVSPVIVKFEKWAGKPRKLYFRQKSKLQSVCLQSNMFAEILASPMRLDKLTRLRSPRELLTQVKLVRNGSENQGQDLALNLAVAPVKSGPTSYVSNNEAMLLKSQDAFLKCIPTSSLNTAIRHINPKDITQPDYSLARALKLKLIEEVRHGLSTLQETSELAVAPMKKSNGSYVRVISDPKMHAKLEIGPDEVLIANLANINDKILQNLFQNNFKGFTISFSTHKRLCFTLYKLLSYTG
ncbi:LAME_0H17348g1_1 [Lachancea meyersii CBS 8951]|uniref:Required for respiratory growth protein 8, mitochondrial n=1 Tax=Lachancea meyersii CBS 8951 TaxID=1266667 RepID=A0A1G4KIJ5_9SACH|nr:LAME_0H17348g1_1 [Lachancea meyersii CBS 8951]